MNEHCGYMPPTQEAILEYFRHTYTPHPADCLIAGVLSNGEQKQNLGTSEEASLLEHCQGEPWTKQILTSFDQLRIDLHHSLVVLYIAHALCLCFMEVGTRYLKQTQGIPQGSRLSTLLCGYVRPSTGTKYVVLCYHSCSGCSFYYGDMERRCLPSVELQNGVRVLVLCYLFEFLVLCYLSVWSV